MTASGAYLLIQPAVELLPRRAFFDQAGSNGKGLNQSDKFSRRQFVKDAVTGTERKGRRGHCAPSPFRLRKKNASLRGHLTTVRSAGMSNLNGGHGALSLNKAGDL